MAGLIAAYGSHQGLRQFSTGNEFAIMTTPAYCLLGVVGGAVLGGCMSLIAISRGEALGKTSLILLPVILGGLAILGAALGFFRIL